MKFSFARKPLATTVSCALALCVASGVASAQTNPRELGYLSGPTDTVVRSGFGLCWHADAGPNPSAIDCEAGAAPKPIAAAVETPQPMAAAPNPEPANAATEVAVVVAEPARVPVARKVTLGADTLFDFDKSELRPAGKQALDRFVDRTSDIEPEMIRAVGHTDRFGSEAYNQSLSQRRVESVKTYLVSKGIDGNRISAVGKGKSEPITKPGDCRGAKSAKVIACLQPDRHVDIEVMGSLVSR